MQMEKVLRQFLEERGLFGVQTDAVVAKVKALPALSGLKWSDDQSGYPPQMVAAVCLNAKDCAIAWMDESCPGHFAREMFK